MDTAYPQEGQVVIRFGENSGGPVTLSLRVPSWARGALARVAPASGGAQEQAAEPGVLAVRRDWHAGDVVVLDLPVEPRFTAADPRIDAVRGCLAVERGPEVLCLESADLADLPDAGGDVGNVRLDSTEPPRDSEGRTVVTLSVIRPPLASWPYGDRTGAEGEPGGERSQVPLTPYHDWANRGPGTMRIWLPTHDR